MISQKIWLQAIYDYIGQKSFSYAELPENLKHRKWFHRAIVKNDLICAGTYIAHYQPRGRAILKLWKLTKCTRYQND